MTEADARLLAEIRDRDAHCERHRGGWDWHQSELDRRELLRLLDEALAAQKPKLFLLCKWGEDCGDVMWWKFPIEEAPYVGSPLCQNWPGYHTHWTALVLPEPPK